MKNALRLSGGVLGWFALALQYVLVLIGPQGADPFTRTINFLSYNTILNNILVAAALTIPVLAPTSALGKFFSRPSVRTAITAYMIIVMAVVFFILRHLQTLSGLDFLCDIILHYVMPVVFFFDWLVFVRKDELLFKSAIVWLIYPIGYMAWSFLHGALTGFYPYPFLNVDEQGVAGVLKFEAGLIAIFLVLGLILVLVGRWIEHLTRP
jgi:hypothetical protein